MSDSQTKDAKQHDLEESPRDKARRLVKGDMQRLTERFVRLRGRLYHHARYLSNEDKIEMTRFLDRELDQTRTVLDGVSGAREFGFSSEVLDDIEP